MTIGHVWGVEIRIDPWLGLLIALALMAGYGIDALLTLLALVIHEAAHLAWAEAEGIEVRRIQLHPLGGRAEMPDLVFRDPRAVWATAAAGPLANLVCAAAFGFVLRHPLSGPLGPLMPDPARTAFFVDVNLALCGLNLLPVIPLDGGQAVRAWLSPRLGEREAVRRLAVLGIACGIGFLAVGAIRAYLGEDGINWMVVGGWIIVATRGELRSVPYQRALGTSARRALLAGGRVLDGRLLVAPQDTAVLSVYRRFATRAYHVICVTDPEGAVLGFLDESRLEKGVQAGGGGVTVGELLGPPPGPEVRGAGGPSTRMV